MIYNIKMGPGVHFVNLVQSSHRCEGREFFLNPNTQIPNTKIGTRNSKTMTSKSVDSRIGLKIASDQIRDVKFKN